MTKYATSSSIKFVSGVLTVSSSTTQTIVIPSGHFFKGSFNTFQSGQVSGVMLIRASALGTIYIAKEFSSSSGTIECELPAGTYVFQGQASGAGGAGSTTSIIGNIYTNS